LRNRLLNHRPSKSRTITIEKTPIHEIYDSLVIQKERFSLLAKPIVTTGNNFPGTQSPTLDGSPQFQSVSSSSISHNLTTIHEKENLEKCLTKLFRESKTIFEERGYNILFLALGFLEWNDPQHSLSSYKSPILLIPVEITKRGARKSFQIGWNEDDISTNLSLKEKLREFGFEYPEFEMPEKSEGVTEYFSQIKNLIQDSPDWKFLDEIYLDFFDYTKFILFKDLDPASWSGERSPLNHPLITTLLDISSERDTSPGFIDSEVDTIPIRKLYHILDADSSQVAVIEDVKSGKNVVVEGPPGTGKSQTIANIIAELLYQEKSVLFVSEKMAALSVVKSRLDDVGLGEFCLELHSRKANKRDFIKSLDDAVHRNWLPHKQSNSIINQLENSRKELDDYALQLHNELEGFQKSPYWIFGRREIVRQYFEKYSRTMYPVAINTPTIISFDRYQEIIGNLKKYESFIQRFYPIRESPFFGCYPDELFPQQIEEISANVNQIIPRSKEIQDYSKQLSNEFGINPVRSLHEFQKIKPVIDIFHSVYPADKSIIFHESWEKPDVEIYPLISKLSDYQSLKKEIDSIWKSEIMDYDTAYMVSKIEQIYARYSDIYPQYSKFNKFVPKYYLEWNSPPDTEILKDFELIRFAISTFYPDIFKVNLHEIIIGYPRIVSEYENSRKNYLELKDQISKLYVNWQDKSDYEILQDLTLASNAFKIFNADFFKYDIEKISKKFQYLSRQAFRIFNSNYRSIKKRIQGYYLNDAPNDNATILKNLQLAIEFLRIFNAESINHNPASLKVEFETRIQQFNEKNSRYQEISDLISHLYKDQDRTDLEKIITDFQIGERAIQKFKSGIFLEGVPEFIEEYRKIQKEYHSVVYEYNKYVKEIGIFYHSPSNKKTSEIISDLNQVSLAKQQKSFLDINSQNASDIFGGLWKGASSNVEELEAFTEWILTLRDFYKQGLINNQSIGLISNGFPTDKFHTLAQKTAEASADIHQKIEKVTELLKPDYPLLLGSSIATLEFEQWTAWFEKINGHFEYLSPWSQFIHLSERLGDPVIEPFFEAIYNDKIVPDDLALTFEGNYLDLLTASIFSERPHLKGFIGEIHEQLIEEFKNLDREIIKFNRKRLIEKLNSDVPIISQMDLSTPEEKVLIREFEKKKRHIPIRQLMNRAGSLVQKIKPCFMMSPLSIAQYLDPSTIQFDVIIFDEASQVKPQDALGALMRGKQAVIMGDSKQLPPTAFFDRMIESDDDTEENGDDTIYTTDIESILQLSKNRFPVKSLRWHYRSRHESLIAVSNNEFYENRLFVYPSPLHETPDLGLKFVHLPNTVYGRGKSQTNQQEAREVAKYVIEHYRKNPEKSLMVGTFNIKQQQAILDEVEYLGQQNPDVESRLINGRGEHFDVKNLETIQGDERDVVLVSVGYGFDENRKLSKNFGPLNQDGGERRLNVLMTRAREKCVIFSNFTSNQLQIDSSGSRGLKALRQFLAYAETGNFPSSVTPNGDFESPFEEAVNNFLVNKGYSVVPQVGCAGFRIDLAIVHPESPGEYVVGIECDGAQYHSSRVARDRDRLRQQILEGLGWKIIRVWSPDWFRNPQKCKDELLKSVRILFENSSKSNKFLPREEKSEIIDEVQREHIGNPASQNESITKKSSIITPKTHKLENNDLEYCPFEKGYELVDYLKKQDWNNLNEWKSLLINDGRNKIINLVWRIYKNEENHRILDAQEKELKQRINSLKKEEYIRGLTTISEKKLEMVRKIKNDRDLIQGIIH
jgi:superfamily I DNA and/or RNA helicase/very-short-patch-repair endonuclease/Fe-S cluster biosynthesis and repair protein YggX